MKRLLLTGGGMTLRDLEDVARRQVRVSLAPAARRAMSASRKTIERHVSNILARTNTRNRTDLARLVSKAQPLAEAVGK